MDPLGPARQHVVEAGVVVEAVRDGDPGLEARGVRQGGVDEDLLHRELALGGQGLVVRLQAEGHDAVGGLGQEGEGESDEESWGLAETHDERPRGS